MGDAGEGLIDADSRLQERMEELEESRKAARNTKPVEDPERVRNARVTEARAHRAATPAGLTQHPARRTQIAQAVEEIDKRLTALS